MAKDMTTFPVSKGKSGKYFGEADAAQIANSGGVLKLFDPDKAKKLKTEAVIDAAADEAGTAAAKVEKVKAAGGADASAVKKTPPSK